MMKIVGAARGALLSALVFSQLNIYAQTDPATDRYFEISKNLELFSNLFRELNTYYVDPIEPGKMVKTGVDAMLIDLDPYTNFITEADIEDYEFQTTGKYGGIGAAIRISNGEIIIAEPYQDSPIDKAGIKAGDIVVSIDGQLLKGKTEEEVGLLMKGAPGTDLKMVVKHPVTGLEQAKTIKRQEIKVSSVPHAALVGPDSKIAYVCLSQFTQNCSRDIKHALDSLKKLEPSLKGVVLDLRNNPGGLLDEAVKICNLFMERGELVVSTKGKNKNWDKQFRTNDVPWDLEIPLAVLINHGSASASEIVSGTVQDIDRGIVIGTRSFGKGLVQTVRPLGYNTRLKVTTAKYYTPSGRCIQALDYSHRNEDGSVSSVPDSLKRTFKTQAGRVVYDGGGVEPDVKIEESELSKLAIHLLVNGYIFDYATKYYYEHPTIAPATSFTFTDADFADFQKWIATKNITYKTESEEALASLKATMKSDNTLDKYKAEYNALAAKLIQDRNQEIVQKKAEISRLLANEIVSRYYYQKGRVVNKLSNQDEDLKKAIDLLNNSAQYKSILKMK
jgi:carboxyl-terminal processing protease